MKKTKNKPIIGITPTLLISDEESFHGQQRSCLTQDYVTAVYQGGGVPMILAVIQDEAAIREQVELVDGIILSGGWDVNPLLYDEEPSALLQFIYPDRDAYELKVIKIAYELKKPILGICRGMQILNVAFGGSLYQDLTQYSISSLQHVQKARRYESSHTVEIVRSTLLHKIFKSDVLMTNSFHHQAVKAIAPGFQVSARARDGVIEAFEKPGTQFVIGVQWHPEMMIRNHPDMVKIFSAFVQAAQKPRRQTRGK